MSEAQRIDALHGLGILDTDPDRLLDRLTRMGSRFLHMPTCLISLVDTDRQWFKSRTGLDIAQTPRDVAFCDHTICGNGVMIVPDATRDPRFRDNPLVTAGIRIRFYAGAPIRHRGQNIGTFCVIDYKPHTHFSDRDAGMLTRLAEMTSELLDKEASEDEGGVYL